MGKSKDLPRGITLNNKSKTSPYRARFNKGDIRLSKDCKSLEEAIETRKNWDKTYGTPKSKALDKESLIGKRFGKLVVKDLESNVKGSRLWKCQCDCGNTAYVTTTNLKSGSTRSCGCMPKGAKHQYDDLTGRRFGKLTVTKYLFTNDARESVWECRCDCGNTCEVTNPQLKRGMTVQCSECRKTFKKRNGGTMVDGLVDNKINDIQVLRYTDKPNARNTTGFRGVSFRKSRNYYVATLTINGKTRTKTGFKTAADAYYNGRLVLEDEYLPPKEDREKLRKEVKRKRKED